MEIKELKEKENPKIDFTQDFEISYKNELIYPNT